MDKLKIGIVGMGNVGILHTHSLIKGAVPRATFSAACDSKDRLETLRGTLPKETMLFEDYDAMLVSGACQAVIVATPHFQHPELSIKALKAGLHVFCEKPAGVTVSSVKKLNAIAESSGKVFSMHFNKRLEPVFQKLRSMIKSGETGRIFRINWTSTAWYRTETYFNSAIWRGTWSGEGGGLLINQCIHDLDIWHYLFGMPQRLRSFCRFGKHHDIEVEDEASVFMDYADGATGIFVAGTGESPGTNRLEIACSRGKIVVENKTIRFHRTSVPLEVFTKTDTKGFGEPEHWICDIPTFGQADLSGGMLRNFVDAVLNGTPLLVNGIEGIDSLELENAILLSTWIDNWVKLPVDASAFDAELQKRMKKSKKKKVTGQARILDLKDSFK
jgi:predicted dehydrogenase